MLAGLDAVLYDLQDVGVRVYTFVWTMALTMEACAEAIGILRGGDTAATDFFSSKTRDKLYAAFKPTVAQKVDEVGATQAFKEMIGRYEKVPFMGSQSLDLDDYVTNKALDGVFYMVGQEEKSIRTNPAARSTELLKTVFGK